MENNEQVNDSAIIETLDKELEVNLEETTEEETVESLKAKLAEKDLQLVKEAEARRQLTARAKAAETKSSPKPQINNPISDLQIERKILKSQGMSDELLNELVALSTVRGKSLLDTQSDPIFIAIKDSKDAEVKANKAKLGASKGSANVKTEKGFGTPGLTDEEHKALFRERMGK